MMPVDQAGASLHQRPAHVMWEEAPPMSAENRKAMTLRLPPDQASALEAVAQVNGVTVAEEVRNAIQARIDALRADPDFQARLRDHLERNREILEGLAST
jgi:hypothetical protein